MGYSLPLQSTGICSMGTVRLPDGRMMERVEHFTGPKGHRKLMISRHNHASEENTPQLQRWTVPMESRALQIIGGRNARSMLATKQTATLIVR